MFVFPLFLLEETIRNSHVFGVFFFYLLRFFVVGVLKFPLLGLSVVDLRQSFGGESTFVLRFKLDNINLAANDTIVISMLWDKEQRSS